MFSNLQCVFAVVILIASHVNCGSTNTQLANEIVPAATIPALTDFSIVKELGVTNTPNNAKPFFFSLNVPYSIKLGEMVTLPTVIFNNMATELSAIILFSNSAKQFELLEEANPNSTVFTKSVNVPSKKPMSSSFLIKPTQVGNILMEVTAIANGAIDKIAIPLTVEPEGVTSYESSSIFIDLQNTNIFQASVPIVIPSDVTAASTKITVTVVGNILGISLENLKNLIQLPTGCGEQSMIKFVSTLIFYKYLSAVGQLSATLQNTLTSMLYVGYQDEFAFMHSDNSFSAFGNSDTNGSTWITAYVCKWFLQATGLIQVNPTIIQKGLLWLANVQASDGSFPEVGNIIYSNMQNNLFGNAALTAYVLTTFLENQALFPGQFESIITSAVNYLVQNLPTTTDMYTLALVTYGLTLAKNSNVSTAYAAFDAMATVSGNFKYWMDPMVFGDATPTSIDIEITAYGLLITLMNRDIAECLPIVKWLLNQQNAQGGFQSTQDTVIALQAFAQYAELLLSANNNLQIILSANDNKTTINVNSNNSQNLQVFNVDPTIGELNVSASGKGFALLSVAYQYNVNVVPDSTAYILSAVLASNSTDTDITVMVCSGLVFTPQQTPYLNMAVLEVNLPSGFTSQPFYIQPEYATSIVQSETNNDGNQVVIYFNSINETQVCVNVNANQTSNVANYAQILVSLSDYYDTSRTAQAFYDFPIPRECNICGPN